MNDTTKACGVILAVLTVVCGVMLSGGAPMIQIAPVYLFVAACCVAMAWKERNKP